jgi:D-alanine-D-alanine ligase
MRLGVVFGGKSAEHEVSVVSAMELLDAADPARFEPVPFGVTRGGRWLTPDETRAQLRREEPLFHKRMEAEVPPLSERAAVLRELSGLDIVFPLVHGVNGEDGTLQGLLEMFGLPYAGCGVAASAIGMDKSLQKDLFRQAGLAVARSTTVFGGTSERPAADLKLIEQTIGYPCFVKPANGGSSVGVSKVRSREDFGDALRSAFSFDEKVLIEELISGREVECGILGNRAPEASGVGEIIPGGEFYDYSAKYLDDSAQIMVPAQVPQTTATALQEAAITAYEAIDASGFARVDFFLTDEDRLVINEINTLPGFRPVSMFPRLWAAAGVTYRELISRIVDLALERFRERKHPHG